MTFCKKVKYILFLAGYTVLLSSQHTKINAQELYVRVSEKDCTNCYAGLFDKLLSNRNSNSFKFLFPEEYQGKRFENFNKLYLRNKVSKDKVVFLDSLHAKSGDFLNNLSGFVFFYDNKVLLSIDSQEVKKYSVSEILKLSHDTRLMLNMKEEGVSSRHYPTINFYDDEHVVLLDELYKNIYLWGKESKSLKKIDLKSDKFQKLLKEKLNKKTYRSHKKYRNELQKFGKDNPEGIYILSQNGNLHFKYYMPYIKLDSKDSINQNLGVRNLLLFSKVSNSNFSVDSMIKNSYLSDNNDIPYYLTFGFGTYEDNLYRINRVIYSDKDVINKTKFPLLSKFSYNEKEKVMSFMGYSEDIQNFSYQEDTEYNNNSRIMDIPFLNYEQFFLIQDQPYAVDVEKKKKYNLDWDADINDIHYPQTITYDNIQFWQKEEDFVVLVKYKDAFLLKTYDKTWNLKKEQELPFNTKAVEDIRFTQKHVYLFTKNELLKMPNVFEE